MKTPTKPSKRTSTDVERAIGGQPENDRDAREADLGSATATSAEGKSGRGKDRAAPAKKGKNRG